jgi:hypothetical protein
MAVYTVHLGFNWNSPTIGAFWSSKGPSDDRFLQYELGTSGQAPAWFHFVQNDSLTFELWDLSASRQEPGGPAIGLALSFSPLDAGTSQTIAPVSLVSASAAAAVSTRQVAGRQESYLDFTSIVSTSGGACPWGPSVGHYGAGTIELTAIQSYKMSFCLKASYSGVARIFLSDPEVIVGSRGG